jgi:hypothetical protein
MNWIIFDKKRFRFNARTDFTFSFEIGNVENESSKIAFVFKLSEAFVVFGQTGTPQKVLNIKAESLICFESIHCIIFNFLAKCEWW